MIYNTPAKGEDGLYFVKVLSDEKRKCLVQLNKVKMKISYFRLSQMFFIILKFMKKQNSKYLSNITCPSYAMSLSEKKKIRKTFS